LGEHPQRRRGGREAWKGIRKGKGERVYAGRETRKVGVGRETRNVVPIFGEAEAGQQWRAGSL
jgi:hypothetical protein